MERLCQSLAEAARDETKKKVKTMRVLRAPMVEERERNDSRHGACAVLSVPAPLKADRWAVVSALPIKFLAWVYAPTFHISNSWARAGVGWEIHSDLPDPEEQRRGKSGISTSVVRHGCPKGIRVIYSCIPVETGKRSGPEVLAGVKRNLTSIHARSGRV